MAKIVDSRKQASSPAAQQDANPEAVFASLKTPDTSPATIRAELMRVPSPNTHSLREGETVWRVAKQRAIEPQELLRINGLTEESARHLPRGATLHLPTSHKTEPSHVLRRGETIYGLAKQRDIDYLRVLLANGLDEASARKLTPGTVIKLGASSASTHGNHAEHKGAANSRHSSERAGSDKRAKCDSPYDFDVTTKTRDQLTRRSTVGHRLVSLDFNDAKARSARGIEIVIPDDATKAERQAAHAYVKGVQEFFKRHGLERPIRGVHTRAEVGRGVKGQFHTEPFFLGDTAALNAIRGDVDGYASVLAKTLGVLDGVTFMPPHKQNDPGASKGTFNERDFAKNGIIPELRKLPRSA